MTEPHAWPYLICAAITATLVGALIRTVYAITRRLNMTDPLFPDKQPCGCPRGEGHRCDPGFKTLEQVRAKYVPIKKTA